jgi:DNA-3-methyladenine glycosylase I
MEASRPRCAWAASALMAAYHDEEWGVPCRDDQALFEMLSLEGAQAGLSWEIVLKKRDGYRRAFRNFAPGTVARFTAAHVQKLLADPGIVRHRGKIESVIGNARCVLEVQRESGSFAHWIWAFVDHKPLVVRHGAGDAARQAAEALSKALRKCGFRFVGATTMYAFMQAAGLIDEHAQDCWRAKD